MWILAVGMAEVSTCDITAYVGQHVTREREDRSRSEVANRPRACRECRFYWGILLSEMTTKPGTSRNLNTVAKLVEMSSRSCQSQPG